jgi:phospholipid/cholesterol/gamma-HCH transport system substrate-binding protein
MAEVTIRVSDRTLRVARILFGGALLVGISYYLWSSGFFIPKYQLSVYVQEASGLTVHAPVRLDGVNVGSVSAIKLAGESASPQRRIELVLHVERRDQDAIRSDSNATLETEGLLGTRYVNISRGFNGAVIKPGGEIPSKPSLIMTLKESMHFFDKTLDCLQQGKSAVDNKAQAPTEPAPKSPR